MDGIDLDSNELCLIDSGIQSMKNVPLRSHLQVLNLHSNYIAKIENLSHLRLLKHLDLSSNHIAHIENLDGLISLRTLNLSCNLISRVEGLSNLRSLVKVNFSYNQIEDITGFKDLAGPDFKLSTLDLHGNKLASSSHVIQCLGLCDNLRELVLSQDGSANPLCHRPGYQREIISALQQLQYLDGVDRSGRLAAASEVLADIPGLDDFMDYLLSSGETPEKDKPERDTPRIAQALQMFRLRQMKSSESQFSMPGTDTESSPSSNKQEKEKQAAHSDHSNRLEKLEEQISNLVLGAKRIEEKESTSTADVGSSSTTINTGPQLHKYKQEARRDVNKTDESEGDSEPRQQNIKKSRKSRIPGYRKTTAATRARKEALSAKGQNVESGNQTIGEDQRMRNDIQSTYVQIMQELEQERERRWKAEQAAKRLATCIQEMHSKTKEERDMKETAIETITKLKQALSTEREAKLRLLNDTEQLKEQLQKALKDLSLAKETEETQKKSLRLMEEMAAKNEREKLEQQTHQHKKVQNAQMHSAALSREVELLRNTVETQKGQIHQLQGLLANREQEHREDLKKRYTLDSKELQEVIHTEVKRIEKEHNQELKLQHTKVDELSKRYSELEDEFRMALQIEANRFKELQVAFETISEENASNKQALLVAHQKDGQSSAMLSELTSLVKEQKGRIAELSKAKLEQSVEHRERIQTLEAHVEEARKRMVQLELLKKENSKLAAEVQAQESVIAGLRAERKLWGQELAKQGSSLSQDRGRLEAQIETAKSELVIVKKQLEKETDALKIKTKILEDQTETIRKLKEGLVERDEEIKKARQESLKIQQSFEDQLAEERGANQEAQENLERLRERKQELKQQVAELEKELEESRKAHTILNNKWKEKSNLIGQLELQVREMKDNWEAKDKKLTSERDKALAAANIAIERLRTADDAFRNQLDQKVQAFQEEIARLEQEKNMETEQANQRVLAVEEEMRELLQENQASKRAMEEKIKRLTHVLGDLQSDLF